MLHSREFCIFPKVYIYIVVLSHIPYFAACQTPPYRHISTHSIHRSTYYPIFSTPIPSSSLHSALEPFSHRTLQSHSPLHSCPRLILSTFIFLCQSWIWFKTVCLFQLRIAHFGRGTDSRQGTPRQGTPRQSDPSQAPAKPSVEVLLLFMLLLDSTRLDIRRKTRKTHFLHSSLMSC